MKKKKKINDKFIINLRIPRYFTKNNTYNKIRCLLIFICMVTFLKKCWSDNSSNYLTFSQIVEEMKDYNFIKKKLISMLLFWKKKLIFRACFFLSKKKKQSFSHLNMLFLKLICVYS